ncbi:uncharacterized protein LOC127983629 [Carassius gibelio]|uniref:uncharacterized protein LOC127983629 n=1 Tax=Carassius gibelio TaxID=101364 RepID=UPI002278AF42|nr:uncharacterized protein LOC127983629 [Carassius gibelio]
MPASMCVGVWVIPAPSLCVVPTHWKLAIAACCHLSSFSKGTLLSGQILVIKEARTTGRCSFSTLLTHPLSMATAPFICDVEASKESLRPAVSSHQLRHRVCSFTLLQVLVGVLAVFVLALTGGVIWMKLFQDCPGKQLWTVNFTGTNTNFTSPRTQKYVIVGSVFTTGSCDKNSFRLHQIPPTDHTNGPLKNEIIENRVAEIFVKYDVELCKEATIKVAFNCNEVKIDEDKSKLFIYQQNSC